MSDDALIDECNHIMIGLDSEEMDEVLTEYFKTGKLSEDNRKKLEYMYCLAYLELGWEE